MSRTNLEPFRLRRLDEIGAAEIFSVGIKSEPPPFPPLEKIRAARKAKRMTGDEVADAVGVDWVTYSRMENGRIAPDEEILRRVEEVLGIAAGDD